MKRTTTATITSAKAKSSNTRHVLPVTWTATEPGPHKRWWWYIGFCIIMFWLMILLFLLRDWLLFACSVTAALAILVTYTRASRQLTYRIDERTLAVNKQTLRLDDYRAFTTQTARAGSDDAQSVVVLLLPKWRLGLHSQIALPESADETTKVLNSFKEVLPFDEAKGYLASLSFLDRFAHWLRLN